MTPMQTAVEIRARLRREEAAREEQDRLARRAEGVTGSRSPTKQRRNEFGQVVSLSRAEMWKHHSDKSDSQRKAVERRQRKARRKQKAKKKEELEEVAVQAAVCVSERHPERVDQLKWDGSRSDAGRLHKCPDCSFVS